MKGHESRALRISAALVKGGESGDGFFLNADRMRVFPELYAAACG
jgi:hypothetical protein